MHSCILSQVQKLYCLSRLWIVSKHIGMIWTKRSCLGKKDQICQQFHQIDKKWPNVRGNITIFNVVQNYRSVILYDTYSMHHTICITCFELGLKVWKREHSPRSCTNFEMVRISEVPLFLIVFDLVHLIWWLSKIGRYARFCLSIDEIFLASERAGQILSDALVPRFKFWP